jgi:aspartate ammonia-lyase
MAQLETMMHERARAFAAVAKIGRTQLQDAVPMTLGDEFRAWGVTVAEDRLRLGEAARLLCEISLGGTATGTGLNAPPGYAAVVCRELAQITGRPLVPAADLIEATQDAGVYVTVSGALKRAALKISKICNDLRLLSSGPQGGFGELRLPPVQAGSSIMPGKVNPVIAEAFNQIAFRVVGTDVTISFAVEAGQLQLNAFGPLIAHELLQAIALLRNGCSVLAARCIAGVEVAPRLLRRPPDDSVGLATVLSRLVGYERASAISREAIERGETVEAALLRHGVLTQEEITELRLAATAR